MAHAKRLTVPAVLLALTAALAANGAFAQTVSCDGCTHQVSVYMGEGGLIATADGAEMVNWRATCNNVTRTGELAPNADGVVSMLFTEDNMLACMTDDDDNAFDLGPVMDGGWFWVTDDMNSAVGGLVNKDVLENDAVSITSAGSGVSMTAGSGAVFLKEAATGRVGILSNILPEPESDPMPATKCGYTGDGTAASPYKRRNTDCKLGSGGRQIIANWRDPQTGLLHDVPDGGTVTRPAGDAVISVAGDLWANGTGHFYVGPDLDDEGGFHGLSAIKGHAEFATDLGLRRTRAHLTSSRWTVKVGTAPNLVELNLAQRTQAHGIKGIDGDNYNYPDASGPPFSDGFGLEIRSDSEWCGEDANYPLTVLVSSNGSSSGSPPLTVPNQERDADGIAAKLSFTVVCP